MLYGTHTHIHTVCPRTFLINNISVYNRRDILPTLGPYRQARTGIDHQHRCSICYLRQSQTWNPHQLSTMHHGQSSTLNINISLFTQWTLLLPPGECHVRRDIGVMIIALFLQHARLGAVIGSFRRRVCVLQDLSNNLTNIMTWSFPFSNV